MPAGMGHPQPPWATCSVRHHPLGEKFPPNIQPKPPLSRFKTIPPCPITIHPRKQPSPLLLIRSRAAAVRSPCSRCSQDSATSGGNRPPRSAGTPRRCHRPCPKRARLGTQRAAGRRRRRSVGAAPAPRGNAEPHLAASSGKARLISRTRYTMNHSSSTLSPNSVLPPMCSGVSPAGIEPHDRSRLGKPARSGPPSPSPRPRAPLTARRHVSQPEALPLPDVRGQQRRQAHRDAVGAAPQPLLAARPRHGEQAVAHGVLGRRGPPAALHRAVPFRAVPRRAQRSASPGRRDGGGPFGAALSGAEAGGG